MERKMVANLVDSENGLQAGIETAILDGADFRGRI